ncbi:MAG: hypothetical protein WC503_02830 [Candidatus Shapirobacteria bacterium]
MVVYKYPLIPVTELTLPEHSEVLKVHAQKDDICLWVKIPTGEELTPLSEKRIFKTIPTGVEFKNERLVYIGTSFMENGLVFHTFEQRMW